MRQKTVAGNWKMNKTLPEGLELAAAVLDGVKGLAPSARVILAPAFIHLQAVAALLKGSPVGLAAQNCSPEEKGAFTGEVSAGMIRSCGAEYVIIGHSERRAWFGEDGPLLQKKITRAISSHLVPIYCVGETLEEREAKRQFDVVQGQLQEAVFHLDPEQAGKIIFAYEPVWAIGTGRNAAADQAQEMHSYIRTILAKKFGAHLAASASILYGGSCNPQNAAALFAQPDVDGGLIGGASLNAADFLSIIKSAN
ncbi:MAG: triose-phosphate isomerase [Bacteroidota bacterium]